MNRASKLEYIEKKISEKNRYLFEHTRASERIALRDVRRVIEKLKLTEIVDVEIEGRQLKLSVDEERLEEVSRLDGCYVIKTDVFDLDKEVIQERYKDLSKVEHAFRTIKRGIEEVRPIYVRKEKRTHGHVFVCMLAYMIVKYMWDELKGLGFTERFIFSTLEKIEYAVYRIRDKELKILPSESQPHQQQILDELKIKLPHRL